MMRAEFDLQAFGEEVVSEVTALRRKAPEWRAAGPYADHLRPLDPLERRELERLERLGRWERQGRQERTRERVARERNQPWREQDRWGLRKRVWRERRDHERELLERRENALLERADELSEHAAQLAGWLRELGQLEPAAQAWCDQLLEHIEDDDLTIAELNDLWQRRRRALERRAGELLAQAVLRAAIGPALAARDLEALAVAIVPPLLARRNNEECTIPAIPALFAVIAIEIDRMRRAGRWAEGGT
jgi:hypothetical protein